jgi:hypothetical protein
MTSLPSGAASGAGTAMRDLKWSPAEKAVILETKSKAAKIQEPSGLWELERYFISRNRRELIYVR